MDRIRNTKLKQSLFLHLILFLTLGIILSLFTQNICMRIEERIWLRNLESIENYTKWQIEYRKEFNDYLPIPSVSIENLGIYDRVLKEICDFGETWSIFFFAFGSALVAVVVFYNNKLKKPLKLLNNCAQEIEKSNLDFELAYDKEDEMGELCEAFEKMRLQLAENNSYMWKMIEEQKQVRAAFTHDIRAPLAVLKGYVQLLLKRLPDKRISLDKQIEMLRDIEEQAQRLEDFSNIIKKVHRLDSIYILKEKTDYYSFILRLKKTISLLHEQSTIKLIYEESRMDTEKISIDYNVVLEVMENIYFNAIRYAESTIKIKVQIINKIYLSILISDDGNGFTEKDIVNACKCYYHDEFDENSNHYGMGL